MKLFLCLDEQGGMAFNGRRQTRDRGQRRHLLALAGGAQLFVSPYTAAGFKGLGGEDGGLPENLTVREDYLEAAGEEDCVFPETDDPSPALERCRELIIYYWNRLYPAELYFPEEYKDHFVPVSSEAVRGSSHDGILCVRYERK